MFAQGGEPSRVLIAHPCWWEGEEAMCRQSRDPQWASVLFTQLQKLLELAKGTHRVNTNSLQQAAAAWWGSVRPPQSRTGSAGMHGGYRKLTAKAKPRIPCASGGNVIRSGFPRTFAEHGVYTYPQKHSAKESGVLKHQCRLLVFPKPDSLHKSEQESHVPPASSSTARKVPYFSNVGF